MSRKITARVAVTMRMMLPATTVGDLSSFQWAFSLVTSSGLKALAMATVPLCCSEPFQYLTNRTETKERRTLPTGRDPGRAYIFDRSHCLRPADFAACAEARIPALACSSPGSQSEDGLQETRNSFHACGSFRHDIVQNIHPTFQTCPLHDLRYQVAA